MSDHLPSDPLDSQLARTLREEYRRAITEAKKELDNAPLVVRHGAVRSGYRVPLGALVGLSILVIVIPLLGRSLLSPTGGLGTAASLGTTAAPPRNPNASLPLGAPTSIDGHAVVSSFAAIDVLANSSDDSSIYVIGWLLPSSVHSCPVVRGSTTWNPCFALHLFPEPTVGLWALSIFGAPSARDIPIAPDGFATPLVLMVHTHDPSCVDASCIHLAVVEMAAWGGRPEAISNESASSAPPSGLMQVDAVAAAIAAAPNGVVRSLSLVSAKAGTYGLVGPGGSDVDSDRWVWAVLLTGQFRAPDCGADGNTACVSGPGEELVVLDYGTGEFLLGVRSTP